MDGETMWNFQIATVDKINAAIKPVNNERSDQLELATDSSAERVPSWGGSRGGVVEPPELNVKTYNKRVVKMEVTLEQLNHFKLPLKTLKIAFQRP